MNKGGATAWVLVEAKATLAELRSDCAASVKARPLIERALADTRRSLDIAADCEWTVTLLPVLQSPRDPPLSARARRHGGVLFIYFTGDGFPRNPSIVCPQSAAEWQPALATMHQKVGWPGNGALDATRARALPADAQPRGVAGSPGRPRAGASAGHSVCDRHLADHERQQLGRVAAT